MDISSLNISVSEGTDEIDDLNQLSLNPLLFTSATGDLSQKDLGEGLTELKHNQDREDKEELDEVPAAMWKENDNDSAKPRDWRAVSLPTPLKLVSAMKGSREKQGTPLKKLTVTWDPDVYDPLPTSMSHMPAGKKQRQRTDSKKSVKNRPKGGGKSKRGKDKKQIRKYGSSSSNMGFKSSDDDARLLKYNERCVELLDIDVGGQGLHCGSIFLEDSVTEMHLSVAEAT